MIRPGLLVALAVSASAWAQEIGSEITPVTPPSSAGQAQASTASAPAAPGAPAPELSAGRLAFGIRAGFQGTAVPVIVTGTGVSGGTAPQLGFSLFVTDHLAIDADLGLSLGIGASGTVPFGFGIGAGLQWYFHGPDRAVRPFVGGKVGFGKNFSTSGDDFSLGVQVGGGAAYFFSPNFSVDARVLVGVAMGFQRAGVDVVLGTLSPGLGATVFF